MRRALFASVAFLGIVGLVAPALAKSPENHTIILEIPNGDVARIQYTGNVPPTIIFEPKMGLTGDFMTMPRPFTPNLSFAMIQKVSANMDREMATLFQNMENAATALMSASLTPAAFGTLWPSGSGYTFASTVAGPGVCTESMQITYSGDGAPKVVSSRSGDCGSPSGTAPVPTRVLPPPSETFAPGTVLANDTAPSHQDLIRKVNWRR